MPYTAQEIMDFSKLVSLSVDMVEYEQWLAFPPELRPERFKILQERLNILFSSRNEL